MTKLWQEELDLLVRELPKLVAEDIVDSDMVGIASKVGDGEEWVLVEDVAVKEPL